MQIQTNVKTNVNYQIVETVYLLQQNVHIAIQDMLSITVQIYVESQILVTVL